MQFYFLHFGANLITSCIVKYFLVMGYVMRRCMNLSNGQKKVPKKFITLTG